jgi:hypothetical protein
MRCMSSDAWKWQLAVVKYVGKNQRSSLNCIFASVHTNKVLPGGNQCKLMDLKSHTICRAE